MVTNNSINQASAALVVGPIGVVAADPTTYALQVVNTHAAAGTGAFVQNQGSTGFGAVVVQNSGTAAGGVLAYGSGYSDSFGGNNDTVIFSNTNAANMNIACENGTLNFRLGASGVIQASMTTSGGTYRGLNTNTAPAAGYIGELISGTATTGTLTSNTAANITSITLSAGNWDISGVAQFNTTGTVVGSTQWIVAISTSSASLGSLVGENGTAQDGGKIPVSGQNAVSVWTGPTRASLSASTSIFLNCRGVGSVTFTNVTCTGIIRAVRVG
jgi:hypothetical protein